MMGGTAGTVIRPGRGDALGVIIGSGAGATFGRDAEVLAVAGARHVAEGKRVVVP